jgi:hypothetical protein
MPLVKNFGVVNGQILQGAIQVGSRLRNVNIVVVKRIPDKDMIFVLDTDKGGVSRRIPGESSGFNADFPVGTIISSMLTWTEFQAITKNNSKNPSGICGALDIQVGTCGWSRNWWLWLREGHRIGSSAGNAR